MLPIPKTQYSTKKNREDIVDPLKTNFIQNSKIVKKTLYPVVEIEKQFKKSFFLFYIKLRD